VARVQGVVFGALLGGVAYASLHQGTGKLLRNCDLRSLISKHLTLSSGVNGLCAEIVVSLQSNVAYAKLISIEMKDPNLTKVEASYSDSRALVCLYV
jgi:hypothetical protein